MLITHAIHTLDLLIWLTGMPQRLTGLASTSPAHRMACEDTAAELLHYAIGAIATAQATTAAYPGFADRIELQWHAGDGQPGSGSIAAGAHQRGKNGHRCAPGQRWWRQPDGL